jgi:hypothetical protein
LWLLADNCQSVYKGQELMPDTPVLAIGAVQDFRMKWSFVRPTFHKAAYAMQGKDVYLFRQDGLASLFDKCVKALQQQQQTRFTSFRGL